MNMRKNRAAAAPADGRLSFQGSLSLPESSASTTSHATAAPRAIMVFREKVIDALLSCAILFSLLISPISEICRGVDAIRFLK